MGKAKPLTIQVSVDWQCHLSQSEAVVRIQTMIALRPEDSGIVSICGRSAVALAITGQ